LRTSGDHAGSVVEACYASRSSHSSVAGILSRRGFIFLGHLHFVLAERIKLRLRRLAWRVRRRLTADVTVETRQGLLTFSTKDQVISRQLYLYGAYEYEPSLRVMDYLDRAGLAPVRDVRMYDIGANIGLIGIGLCLSGKVKEVVSVEPAPGNFALLKRNVRQNGLDGCFTTVPAALGAEAGEISLELSGSNFGDHRVRSKSPRTERETFGESNRTLVTIPSMRLDDLVARTELERGPAPSMVWIDVQGYEGYVFQGGRSWLGGGIPVYSEVWPYGILRAGMELDEFCDIAESIWTHFHVWERGDLAARPMAELRPLMDALGPDGSTNILFANLPVGGSEDARHLGSTLSAEEG